MDVIILAGGQGTRVRHLLPEGTPKCMADIDGRPFLEIIISNLRRNDFDLVFATGYGHEAIFNWITHGGITSYSWMRFSYEMSPMGTAGAIKLASWLVHQYPIFIFNGDTICDVDYKAMLAYHKATNSMITVACDKDFRHVGIFIASRRFIDFIPSDCKVDMAEVFMLLGQKHKPVGWFMTDAPFYDIGDEKGLEIFRAYWPLREKEKCAVTSV